MSTLKITINKIKGITHGVIDIPISNDLYAIVGNNGSGKSTIMLCLSQLVGKYNLSSFLTHYDYTDDSYIEYEIEDKKERWFCDKGFWKSDRHPELLDFNGTYEGSLFYGARFKDSKNVDELIQHGKILEEHIVPADEYIQNKLGEILHDDPLYYSSLRRIRNKKIANNLKLQNTPYFINFKGKNISQYRMSSGECLLISLLHFVYNSLVRRSLPVNKPIIMLIDEIELALHPVAVSNFIIYIKELLKEYNNLTVIITSHSTEVIRNVKPNNMFKLERINSTENEFNIVNPCYPSYAIRDLYQHSGYDSVILVEDKLAKVIVENAIKRNNLTISKLINIIPVGGWDNVLTLHKEIIINNVLGINTDIISILDGDVTSDSNINRRIQGDYKDLKKTFLPIPSVEKYLHKIMLSDKDPGIIKELTDYFFQVKSLKQIFIEYKKEVTTKRNADGQLKISDFDSNYFDKSGKKFYAKVEKDLESRKISEDLFIGKLFELIYKYNTAELEKFGNTLEKLLQVRE